MGEHGCADNGNPQLNWGEFVSSPLPTKFPTKLDIIILKGKLKNWVTMPMDKDNGNTYVMCPQLYWHRLNKLFSEDIENYELAGFSRKEVTDILTRGLQHMDKKVGKTATNGHTPYVYSIPKAKDPINKDRPIMSYFHHPQKGKLSKAGRALMWILTQLQSDGVSKSFATFKTTQYVQAMKHVTLPPHATVYLGDVKNMYTNIEHANLMRVIQWVMDTFQATYGSIQVFVPNAKTKPVCQYISKKVLTLT